jgi:hypothetical protein
MNKVVISKTEFPPTNMTPKLRWGGGKLINHFRNDGLTSGWNNPNYSLLVVPKPGYGASNVIYDEAVEFYDNE